MKYSAFKQAQSDEFAKFPCAFAFSDDQLEKAKTKLGVKDISELYAADSGMLYKKTDAPALKALMQKLDRDRAEYLKDPENLKSALIYELSNHEYIYTYDSTEALDALGLDRETLTTEQCEILRQAKTEYLATAEE